MVLKALLSFALFLGPDVGSGLRGLDLLLLLDLLHQARELLRLGDLFGRRLYPDMHFFLSLHRGLSRWLGSYGFSRRFPFRSWASLFLSRSLGCRLALTSIIEHLETV